MESLPADLRAQVLSLAVDSDSQRTLDSILRFALQQKAATNIDAVEWNRCQSRWINSLQSIGGAHHNDLENHLKRAISPNGQEVANASKKPKLSTPELVTGYPLYVLHGISCTSPLRKKLDITIGTDFISFAQPSNGTLESSIRITSLDMAFLLPTPGKSKAYYTFVLMSTSAQLLNETKKTKAETPPIEQIIFGVEAISTTIIKTTEYSDRKPNALSTASTLPKAANTLPLLLTFAANLPPGFAFYDASRGSFRSRINKEDCCVTAYLRAKEGHLYFFREGVLFGEKKPCVWFKVQDMMSVRVVSATGKTASVYIEITRHDSHPDSEDDDEEGDTIEFGMIDGREMEAIGLWIQSAEKRFFDPTKRVRNAAPDEEKPREVLDKGKAREELVGPSDSHQEGVAIGDEDEESDEDFKTDSDSDGGEPSSDSESHSGGGEAESEEEGSGDDDGDEKESDNEGRHPLLQPGAMPKMSRAAIEAAVGIVERDFGMQPNGEEDELMSD